MTPPSLPVPPVSSETLIGKVVAEYLPAIAGMHSVSLVEIRDQLLGMINGEIALENSARRGSNPSSPRMPQLLSLPADVAAEILLARYRIVVVDLANKPHIQDTMPLALYLEGEGIYTTSEKELHRLVLELCPGMSKRTRTEVAAFLFLKADRVRRTIDPDLIPVSNGVFDHAAQELLPFSSEYVFLSKIAVAYNPNAANSTITMPDGVEWDLASWLEGLSDDEGVPLLLWEVISAAVRSHVPWKKCILAMGTSGNNGKGSFVRLLRNLVGRENCAAIPIADFSDRFAKGELMRVRVNLVDENAVNEYLEDTKDYKAAITGDDFRIEEKHKAPVWMSWCGFMLQCINAESVRTRDKSGSLVRRHLMIPFRKNFTAGERKYIKDDYLARKDVLEFVLKEALAMKHTEFSNPPACAALALSAHQQNSSPVAFWEEFSDLFVWDLLPWEFLYDLFISWHRRNEPSGRVEGKASFLEAIKAHLAGSSEWEVAFQRPGSTMNEPEFLIAEYGLDNWKNSSYPGTDPDKKCITSPLKANYKGLKRIIPTSTSTSTSTAAGSA